MVGCNSPTKKAHPALCKLHMLANYHTPPLLGPWSQVTRSYYKRLLLALAIFRNRIAPYPWAHCRGRDARHTALEGTPWGARRAGDKGLKGTQMCGELILTASTHPSPKTFHRTHTVWAHRRAPGSQSSPVKRGSAIWQVLPLPEVCKARRVNWGQVSLPGVCYGKREGLRNLPEITQSGVGQSASFHTPSSVFFLAYLLLRWQSSEQTVPDFAVWFQRKSVLTRTLMGISVPPAPVQNLLANRYGCESPIKTHLFSSWPPKTP